MPCFYFVPTNPVSEPSHAQTRVPLIEEHDGYCQTSPEPVAAVSPMRWQCCNQGYSLGRCPQFPAGGSNGGLRYSVTRQSGDLLEIVWVDERDHAPFRYGGLNFAISKGCLLESGVDAIIAAQALAYCRSYMRLYTSGERNHTSDSQTAEDLKR